MQVTPTVTPADNVLHEENDGTVTTYAVLSPDGVVKYNRYLLQLTPDILFDYWANLP